MAGVNPARLVAMLSQLVGLVRRKEVRYHKDLPPDLLAKIKAAIQISPLVADETKLLL